MSRVQLWCFCAASWCFVSQSFVLYAREENGSMLWNDKGSAVKLNVMLLILFYGGEIVFRCNNLEEFIRVFKRRNKQHKKGYNNEVLF